MCVRRTEREGEGGREKGLKDTKTRGEEKKVKEEENGWGAAFQHRLGIFSLSSLSIMGTSPAVMSARKRRSG